MESLALSDLPVHTVRRVFPTIISLSDNSWESGLTGRQHVLGRLARRHRTFYINPLHDLRSAAGWLNPKQWGPRWQSDPTGVRVLHWPVWLGQCYRPRLEQLLLEKRQRLLTELAHRETDGAPPILYVWHPDQWPLVEHLPASLVCYHVYDHYELLAPQFRDRIAANHERLAERADVVICVSAKLADRFGGVSNRVHVVPNGADYPHFSRKHLPEPPEITDLPHPRLMLVARLNGNYNYRLMREVIDALQFPLIIVGPRRGMPDDISDDFDDLIAHPRVRWVGEQPFERLPEFVNHCDIGLIPYRAGTSSDFASPLKLFEYLAAGKGVVTADVESVHPYQPVVGVADSADQWIRVIKHTLNDSTVATDSRRTLARANSWDARVERIEMILNEALTTRENLE